MAIKRAPAPTTITKERDWYKDAIIYEVHVRAFCDSNADGIGDFRGLTQKLDYLQDLGVTAIWLLPFYPSPLKDDGYDIADYYSINPIYGTLKDFKVCLDEAHKRGLRVITELVVNHTSDQHPWFQKSRRAAPGSHWRGFYVWSETAEPYSDARIIFRDFEHSNWSWDPVANAYFWHRFYSHQPDLNYDNPAVHKEIIRVLDFWFDMGVDGLRLDAVPYLFEREGTSSENLPETHQFLKKLRQHVDEKYGDRMLLAEANQWPEDAVAYFGSGKGDECHMAFHFPLMPRMFMAIRMEDRVPIVDILDQTPGIPPTSQWALFLRNHDELTLEMVTDEERDYMYRVYANDAKARINLGIRRRLAPLLGNDRKRIELLHLLLFSLPGTPVLYYGDEIGMGDNVYLGDRNGVRTPMQWSSDRNAGFSRATPQALYLPIVLEPEYHYEAVNVDVQQRNPHSLFWWVKRAITLRKRHPAFGRGTMEFVPVDNRKVLAFVRRYDGQVILVVANLSRFTQPAELDLSAFQGCVPVELFGQTAFPLITSKPYFLALSPHSAHWFVMETAASRQVPPRLVPGDRFVTMDKDWDDLLAGAGQPKLEASLVRYLEGRRWFPKSDRDIKNVQIREVIRIGPESNRSELLILNVEFHEGEAQEYLLPIAIAPAHKAAVLERDAPQLIIARVRTAAGSETELIYEAVADEGFCREMFRIFTRRKPLAFQSGTLQAVARQSVRQAAEQPTLDPALRRADRHHSTIVYGNKLFLKLYRRMEAGQNPELQMARFLARKGFRQGPKILGWLEFRRNSGESIAIASLREFLPEARDGATYMVETVTRYFERVRSLAADCGVDPALGGTLFQTIQATTPEGVVRIVGTPLELARLLGQRTAEMHQVLASEPENKDFSPEPFTPFYQRSLFQSFRNMVVASLRLLRRMPASVPGKYRELASKVAGLEHEAIASLRAVHTTSIDAKRIRCHEEYHLGQLLYTGKDFVAIDFEGDPSKPFGERRIKHSALYDVAAMLRSFDRVSADALMQQLAIGALGEDQIDIMRPWAAFWARWVGASFLRSYLHTLGDTDLLPRDPNQSAVLLRADLLGRCFQELRSDLLTRPESLGVPLHAILRLVRPEQAHVPPWF